MDVGSGWPGHCGVLTGQGMVPVALHVSLVGSHARQIYELRFQNPADSSPVMANDGRLPILVGLANEGPQAVLVAVDGSSRIGRKARFSILFNRRLLNGAIQNGWEEYISGTGEHIFAMHPRLFPIYVEALAAGVTIAPDELVAATAASGVAQEGTNDAAERARRVASILVRDAAFSKEVRRVYEDRCAMCGLSLDLVVGAHILPVKAPGSKDVVWNGVALCHNHHAGFDKHYIWVAPTNREIKLRPDILKFAKTDAAAMVFAQNTRPILNVPTHASWQPRAAMFNQRYQYFSKCYDWA